MCVYLYIHNKYNATDSIRTNSFLSKFFLVIEKQIV